MDPAEIWDAYLAEVPNEKDRSPQGALAFGFAAAEKESAKLRDIIKQAVDAHNAGQLEMNSPDIAADNGMPPHHWHEEWLHHARAAI